MQNQQQTLGLHAHYLQAYGTDLQLHAVFEMYRAFPANAQFNFAQRGPNDVPLFFATEPHLLLRT
jgi:hypothetical protein